MIIDVNASLGYWPFQKFGVRTASQLDRHFAELGVGQAWVSSVEAILSPDIDACNEELVGRLRPYPRLKMVPTINPVLANWAKSLDKWAQRGVHAIKVYPNYHQYDLTSATMCEVARQAASRRMVLLVQMRVEDERGMYAPMRISGVSVDDVVNLAKSVPEAAIIALCAYYREAVQLVAMAPKVMVDLSFIEACDTVKTLLRDVPAGRVVFGSHTPFLCTRAELMKLEAANVSRQELRLIREANARGLGKRFTR